MYCVFASCSILFLNKAERYEEEITESTAKYSIIYSITMYDFFLSQSFLSLASNRTGVQDNRT